MFLNNSKNEPGGSRFLRLCPVPTAPIVLLAQIRKISTTYIYDGFHTFRCLTRVGLEGWDAAGAMALFGRSLQRPHSGRFWMFLKQIEVENFKSFGKKMTIPMMNGFTAV